MAYYNKSEEKINRKYVEAVQAHRYRQKEAADCSEKLREDVKQVRRGRSSRSKGW